MVETRSAGSKRTRSGRALAKTTETRGMPKKRPVPRGSTGRSKKKRKQTGGHQRSRIRLDVGMYTAFDKFMLVRPLRPRPCRRSSRPDRPAASARAVAAPDREAKEWHKNDIRMVKMGTASSWRAPVGQGEQAEVREPLAGTVAASPARRTSHLESYYPIASECEEDSQRGR